MKILVLVFLKLTNHYTLRINFINFREISVYMAKNKFAKFLATMFRFIWIAIVRILKWLFVDLFKTLAKALYLARNPEENTKINRNLDSEKKLSLHDERIERVERLIYSVYNDPEYSKSDKGKHDLKVLKERVR